MEEKSRIPGSSFESFAAAAASAFDDVPGDPNREGVAEAQITRMWLSKGGIVGRMQYHVELEVKQHGRPPD